MAWYAAHAILYLRLKSGAQDSYPVWENIYLVSGATSDAALADAIACAQRAAGDSSGTMTLDEQPAEWVFAGIRKLISVAHMDKEEPSHGDELSYSEYSVKSLSDIDKLADGDSVEICYVD